LVALFTIGAKAVERDLGTEDLVTRCLLEFPDRRLIDIRLPIDDLVALDADQVRMGLRAVAVVVAVITQVNLQYLAHILEQCQGLVYRGMAHGGELALDPAVELDRTGMPSTGRDQPHQLDPLGGQAEGVLFQRGDQFNKANFRIRHNNLLRIYLYK